MTYHRWNTLGYLQVITTEFTSCWRGQQLLKCSLYVICTQTFSRIHTLRAVSDNELRGRVLWIAETIILILIPILMILFLLNKILPSLTHTCEVALDISGSLIEISGRMYPGSFDGSVNSLAPGGLDSSLKLVNGKPIPMINIWQTHINDKYLKYFLWNCYQVNATTPHWSLVNIGSGNGLVPSGNKPLPEPMLT